MKKPIKFRAKSQKSGKWVYGYYAKYNMVYGTARHCIQEAVGTVNVVTIDYDTLGQLVTVQDGAEIYEGDLVEEFYIDEGEEYKSLFPIVWDPANLLWALDTSFEKNGIHFTSLSDWFGNEPIKINGNIHDSKNIAI